MLTQEADTLARLARTHTHTPLYPPSDAILITSLRFDLSPLDQMADVFILEGEEMNKKWLHSVTRWERGRVCWRMTGVFVYPQGDHRDLVLGHRTFISLVKETGLPGAK